MNRRRSMNSLHREGHLRAIGVLPPLPTPNAVTMPFEQIPIAELDKAGAALLPKDDDDNETPYCAYCNVACFASAPLPFCSNSCAAMAESEGHD